MIAAMPRHAPIAALALATLLTAQADLRRGDRIVFLGDSITHQGFWVASLECALLAAMPELELEFFNAGVGGDVAAQALARMADEVVAQKPALVFVLLGMNDGGYRERDDAVARRFADGLQRIVGDVARCGARAIVLGPTFYDSAPRARRNDPKVAPREFYNDVLLGLEALARDAAKDGFVALNAPMAELTRELRASDPAYTMVPDGIHPDAAGGFVIAATILRELWREAPPVEVTLAAPADEERTEALVELRRIPCPVPAAAHALRGKLDFDRRWNRFVLRAAGAPRGRYALSADGTELGMVSGDELNAGVDLLPHAQAPWNQKTARLAELAEHRRVFVERAIRNQVGRIKSLPDAGERATRYAAIHAELKEEWRKVAAVEQDMRALCRPFTVRFTLERRGE
jgi:lysophospholipase L1-like esterase